MATQEKQRTPQDSSEMLAVDIRDHELQQTLNDFLDEEQVEEKPNVLVNFANAAGIGLLSVGALHLVKVMLGLSFLPDVTELLQALPVIGAIFISVLGFGFFTYERKLRKLEKKRSKSKLSTPLAYQEAFSQPAAATASRTADPSVDLYALRRRKRLYKSVTDKKLFGVCGGIAKFFGVESTVIRFIFGIAPFLTSGFSIVVYLALAIALSKEPPELQGPVED